MKVSKLEGAELDYWVAKADDHKKVMIINNQVFLNKTVAKLSAWDAPLHYDWYEFARKQSVFTLLWYKLNG